ncbi:MAG TPA: hypothetical protein VHB70_13865 [Parafilimonas sp.]|nr:hypothetical protein [Parafilimonas sp.]
MVFVSLKRDAGMEIEKLGNREIAGCQLFVISDTIKYLYIDCSRIEKSHTGKKHILIADDVSYNQQQLSDSLPQLQTTKYLTFKNENNSNRRTSFDPGSQR